MVKKFNPPSLAELPSVDVSGCKYPSEVVEIVGVVSLSGQGGWPKCDDYEVHNFQFAAWRRLNQSVAALRTLTILHPVESVKNAFDEFPACTVHKLEVLLSDDETRAIFVARGTATFADAELEAIGLELQQPITIQTERYGVLTLNRSIDWFEGEAEWNGYAVSLLVEADENLDISRQLETAEALFSDSENWGQLINEFAVTEKLELANDWRDDETEPITGEEFLECMTLNSISIKREGEFAFWHDDGDLFCGHAIVICGSLKDGPTRSDIRG